MRAIAIVVAAMAIRIVIQHADDNPVRRLLDVGRQKIDVPTAVLAPHDLDPPAGRRYDRDVATDVVHFNFIAGRQCLRPAEIGCGLRRCGRGKDRRRCRSDNHDGHQLTKHESTW